MITNSRLLLAVLAFGLAMPATAFSLEAGVREVPAKEIPVPTAGVSQQEQSVIGAPLPPFWNDHPKDAAEWKALINKRAEQINKTLPGLRTAQKYAVLCGGAQNHRIGLFDMVLIKENHIATAGSISAAIATARRTAPGVRVEVEVESMDEFDQALAAKPDMILIDDCTHADMRKAVAHNRERGRVAKLEASGSVSLATVRDIAEIGVDYISVGSLTKHVRAIDHLRCGGDIAHLFAVDRERERVARLHIRRRGRNHLGDRGRIAPKTYVGHI